MARPKGSKNIISKRFVAGLVESGFDPLAEMQKIYQIAMARYQEIQDEGSDKASDLFAPDGSKYLKIALSAVSDMSSYVIPKLKTIEHTHTGNLAGMTPAQKLEAMRLAVIALEHQVKNEKT